MTIRTSRRDALTSYIALAVAAAACLTPALLTGGAIACGAYLAWHICAFLGPLLMSLIMALGLVGFVLLFGVLSKP